MSSPLPQFHHRALEQAEETLEEARAARDAADRLLDEIDQLIAPRALGPR